MHADFLTKNLPCPKIEHNIKAIKLFQDRQGKVLKLSDSYSNKSNNYVAIIEKK